MAFDQQQFARVEITQQFDRAYNPQSGAVNNGCADMYTYKSTTDNLATISAADYFLPMMGYLQPKDLIYVNGTDNGHFLTVVLSGAGTVTTRVMV